MTSDDARVLIAIFGLTILLLIMYVSGHRAGRRVEREAWERSGLQQTKLFQEILIKIGIPAISGLDERGRQLDPQPDAAPPADQA